VTLHVLRSGLYEDVLWLDSDAGFAAPELPLSLLRVGHSKPIVAGKHVFFADQRLALLSYPWTQLNAGVLLFGGRAAEDLIAEALRSFLEDPACRDAEGRPAVTGVWGVSRCYEQGMLNRLLLWRHRGLLHCVGPRLVHNAYWYPSEPVFIVHVFGPRKSELRSFEPPRLGAAASADGSSAPPTTAPRGRKATKSAASCALPS
jgi:hypothetical protein